jgi:hypothetical protein
MSTLEQSIAKLIRMMGSSNENERVVAMRKLGNLLAENGVSFTDLGDAVERLATGGLEESVMQRCFDEGRRTEREELECRRAEGEALIGKHPDGSYNWPAILNFCQREHTRIRDQKSADFIADIAPRLLYSGREPSLKQGEWILGVFAKLGGRVA